MQTEHWNDETPLDPEASREISQEQPKPKRRRNDESQSMSTSISGSEIPMRSDKITQKTENQNREVESVEHLRKRKNKHEYLVKWKDADKKQWIERDIMIAEHPQSVIAYLQTLIDFRWSNVEMRFSITIPVYCYNLNMKWNELKSNK